MEITQQVIAANDKLISLVKIDARSAILEAWRNLEESLREAVIHKAGSTIPNVQSSFKVLSAVEKMHLLPPKEIMIARDLRGLRNQAAHLRDFNPSEESAYKFIELAKILERKAKDTVELGS